MIPSFINRIIYRSRHYLVKQNWRYRWLAQPDGTIHSRLNRRAIHKPALEYMMPMLQLCQKDSGQYLMLGLGGGALLHALENKFDDIHIDVIEINPEIINIAKQFFYVDTLHSSTIIENDANTYVSQCDKTYDAILIDLYQDNEYPNHCATSTFFQNCQRLMTPQGVVIINCANMAQYPQLLNQLRLVFNNNVLTIRIQHPRNVILACSNQSIQLLINQLPLKKLGWHADTGVVGNMGNA
ncbi:spermidine synthase [Legionella sp. W05-934-2]|jgi:spermidine synthase|uniref:spermidine synthase n=1 Tax=Legionella sp. W05-934-2 TaxID=1198649 RepID=UPI003461BA9C